MKIINKMIPITNEFNELAVGDMFLDRGGKLFMKIDSINANGNNVVALNGGKVYCFDEDYEVSYCEGIITIDDFINYDE